MSQPGIRFIKVALSMVVISGLPVQANAKSDGTASISYMESGKPGVSAEAHSYVVPEAQPPSPDDSSSSSAPDGEGSSPSALGISESSPKSDFYVAGQVEVPNPCIRRRFGGNYCDPAAPAPEAPDKAVASGPRGPSPEELARTAVDRAVALAPSPRLDIAPSRLGLTGLDSYFWLAEPLRPITATAGVPGLTVTARAVPTRYVWNFGDGTDAVTAGPGTEWTRRRPGSISHLYETKGSYVVAVSVIWQASFSVNGGPWSGIGSFTTTDSRRYRVQEVVPVLVPGD